MGNPHYAAWMGLVDPGPWVKSFEPWVIEPAAGGRRSFPHASEVAAFTPDRLTATGARPFSFAKVPVSIDPAVLAELRSCVDLASECRREWSRVCEAMLRAALVAVGAIPAGAEDHEAIAILSVSPGRLLGVVQPDGSQQCFWGSAYLCTLPPDPLSAMRAGVDARLRDGSVSGAG